MGLEADLEEERVDHLLTYSSIEWIQLLEQQLLVDEVRGLAELLMMKLQEQLYVDAVEGAKMKDLP